MPERGLRQGDPLSPYLFIICTEGFSALLRKVEFLGALHRCKIIQGALSISHLFFADDCLLFFKANAEESMKIKDCLRLYEEASGQVVNFQKSSIFFSPNSTTISRNDICHLLGVPEANGPGTYLGLPAMIVFTIAFKDGIESFSLIRVVGGKLGTKATQIISDPWLPDENNPFIASTLPAFMCEWTVKDLIEEHNWKSDLILSYFNKREADLILSIPLSFRRTNDDWYWLWDRKGTYTVKNAYKKIWDCSQLAQNHIINWNFKIPSKVCNFVWRACQNCLPTKEALSQKNVNLSLDCPVCLSSIETVFHILVECPFARRCWSFLPCFMINSTTSTFQIWLSMALDRVDEEDRCKISMIAWSIWKSRNQLVWSNRPSFPSRVIQSDENLLCDWQAAQVQKHSTLQAIIVSPPPWTKMQRGWPKCNMDAAIFQQLNKTGMGFVIRDENGDVVMALSKAYQGLYCPSLAKSLGFKESLSRVESLKMSKIIFELDAENVVKAIQEDAEDSSYFCSMILDCKQILKELGENSVVFVRRSTNQVAHRLARAASFLTEPTIWHNYTLVCLMDVIELEK